MIRNLLLFVLAAKLSVPTIAQVFQRRAGEGDTAFVLRNSSSPKLIRQAKGKSGAEAKAPGKASLAHGPITAYWNSTPVLIAFFSEVPGQKQDALATTGDQDEPKIQGKLEGHVYADAGKGRYRHFVLGAFPENSDKHRVTSVFFANADKDSQQELIILLKWEESGQPDNNHTRYGAFVYDDLAALNGNSLLIIRNRPAIDGETPVRTWVDTSEEPSNTTAGEVLATMSSSPNPMFLYQQDGEYADFVHYGIRIDTCGQYCLRVDIGGFDNGGFMDGARISTDTCGVLGNRLLICTEKTITQLSPFYAYAAELTIEAASLPTLRSEAGKERYRLLTWMRQSGRNVYDLPEFPTPKIEASNNDLKLFDVESGNKLAAHFLLKGNRLEAAPSFRKRLIGALARVDTGLGDPDYLRSWIDPGDWSADRSILQVLDLQDIRTQISSGNIDHALHALAEIAKDPAEDFILKRSRHLLDSLSAWKEAHRPVAMEGARRIGRLLSEPFYPPLDSPSVFWRDSVLCVVQTEGEGATGMRAWNPRSGAWSKVVKIKYPETGITSLFEFGCDWKPSFEYSRQDCWSRKMKEPSGQDCPLLDCAPLLILDGADPGSVENVKDLAKAGGSSAAGLGRYKFAANGMLYYIEDNRVGWRVLPGAAAPVFGRKSYEVDVEGSYPVVVSPNQEWVAFALRSKDEKSIELWVGRLRYRE